MDDKWIKIDIFTTSEGVDTLGDALNNLGHHSFTVTDAADLEKLMEGKYGAWDYIDPELMKLGDVETSITLYIPDDHEKHDRLSAIQDMLVKLKESDNQKVFGSLDFNISTIANEKWGDSWKKDYDPIIIGEKFIVCPTWMEHEPGKRIIIKIDPGQAFGTGLDETTKLCLEALERTVDTGCSVLDIGCGSGILSIAALLAGAGNALGIDIDDVAVRTAKENAELNGVSDRAGFICAIPADIKPEPYDIVCANISADTIITAMPEIKGFMKQPGTLIFSGIIENRKQDILDTLLAYELSNIECTEKNGWVCFTVKSRTSTART